MSHRKVSSEKHRRGKHKALSKRLRRQNPFPSVILLKTQYRYNHSPIPVLELVMIISISLFPSLCGNCTKLHKRHHLQNEPRKYFSSSILASRLWTIKQESCPGMPRRNGMFSTLHKWPFPVHSLQQLLPVALYRTQKAAMQLPNTPREWFL